MNSANSAEQVINEEPDAAMEAAIQQAAHGDPKVEACVRDFVTRLRNTIEHSTNAPPALELFSDARATADWIIAEGLGEPCSI